MYIMATFRFILCKNVYSYAGIKYKKNFETNDITSSMISWKVHKQNLLYIYNTNSNTKSMCDMKYRIFE